MKSQEVDMGFISHVQERLDHPQDFADFKDLIKSYQMMVAVGVPRPKVYVNVTQEELKKFNWIQNNRRLPNIFVIRPSVFLNARFDYFLRDDGARGLTNFTQGLIAASPKEVMQLQRDNIEAIAEKNPDVSLLFEEFPLVGDTLQYPTHYRVHTFHDAVGLIQVDTRQDLFWMTPDRQVADSVGGKDVESLVPAEDVVANLCQAASIVGKQTKLPYVRIDFVSSTRGPLFRGFACVPGDVRSETYRWFYSQHDERLGKLWDSAQKKLQDVDDDHSDKSDATPTPPPDDNA
jgi:hypothetical protein